MKQTIRELQDRFLAAKDGEVDPLEVYIQFKQMKAELETLIKGLQDDALAEMDKYGKGQHTLYGALVQVKMTPGRWDFTRCTEFNAQKDALRELEAQLKGIAKNGGAYLDQDTGEIWELPIQEFGVETVEVKQLKQ